MGILLHLVEIEFCGYYGEFETATETSVESTVRTISDIVPAESIITTSLGETEEHTTEITNEPGNDVTTLPSRTSFTATTKTNSIQTEIVEQTDETTQKNILDVIHETPESTTLQDDVDTTTELIFSTIISRTRGITEKDDEYQQDTTTFSNDITEAQTTSRYRTERPFRGPLRLKKHFKKKTFDFHYCR